MKKHIFTVPLLTFLICILSFSKADSLEATGEGINQRQALNAALRTAVEMSLGTEVEANTLVENFQVVRQQILNHTKGYVRSYEILKEEKPSPGLTRVTIEADVDNQSLHDSSIALSTLMKMADHPRVLVVGIDEDFYALSSLSDEFRLLTETVEAIVRDDFKFDVLDSEAVRLSDTKHYRYSDRKNNLLRAKRANADYLIFVEVLQGGERPHTLRLESVDVATKASLAKEEVGFAMTNWTNSIQSNRKYMIDEAKDHIYGPSAQVAAALTERLKKKIYEDGQRYEVSFSRFDAKILEFVETDLANLSGYVRHKLLSQKKNALTLSYWSLLKPGALNVEISNLLKGQDQTFHYQVHGSQLSYRFDDPMFE